MHNFTHYKYEEILPFLIIKYMTLLIRCFISSFDTKNALLGDDINSQFFVLSE